MQCLDLKGREKFLDTQSITSYMGCAHCGIQFPKGVSGPIFGIARRYLPVGHRLRRQIAAPYEYSAPECLMPPPLKDTAFVKYAAHQAIAQNMKHFLGQKGLPMFADLKNFVYENMNIPDWAHNCSGMFKWIIELLVGPNGEGTASSKNWTRIDKDHRVQAQKYGVFPDIWPDRPIYLDSQIADTLRGT